MAWYDALVESGWLDLTYEELSAPDTSPKERYTETGFEATMYFMTNWNVRHAFCQSLRGGPVRGSQGYVFPARYPDFPAAVCISTSIEGFGKPVISNGRMGYEKARITAEFSTKAYETQLQQLGEAFIQESIEGAAEFLTIPAEGLYWDDKFAEALTDAEAPGKIYKTITWNYTLMKVNSIPKDLWDAVGCVNKKKLYSPTFRRYFEPETLLFNPPSLRREIAANAIRSWEVGLHMTIKDDGWNKVVRRGGDEPTPIYYKKVSGTGNQYKEEAVEFKIYKPIDFGSLVPLRPK